jgi:hypothetical protein
LKENTRTRSPLVRIMLVLAALCAALISPVGATPATAGTGPVGGINPIGNYGLAVRVLDTRKATGPVPGGGSVLIDVAGQNRSFPSGTQAVVLNITATDGTAAGFLTAFNDGVSAPGTSNVNYGPGQMVSNLTIVEVGATGKIRIENSSAGSVHIVVDASAYYDALGVADAPGSYRPLVAMRALDTRTSSGAVAGGKSVVLPLGGTTGVPTNASAVVMNLTVTQPTSYGFITAYPTGSLKPNVSNQNYVTGQTVPNLAVVPVGADGSVTIANTSPGTAHVIADVVGYFLPGTPAAAGAFAPIAPSRFLDTRTSGGPVGSAYTVPVQVAGVKGVPRNATGVWVNLTVTEPTTFGYFTARPHKAPWSDASNLNFNRGQTIANMAYLPIGADGQIEIQPILQRVPRAEFTHVILDVFGYTLP